MMNGKTTSRIVRIALALLMVVLLSSGIVSGQFNPDAEASVNARGVVSYPFFDDMESGVGDWVADPPWGLTDQYAHSGNCSWTDSPGTSYENNVNTALTLSIDMGSANMPVLSFWHRYAFETNADWGYIDVSTNQGQSWTTIYFVTGQSTEWKQEKIDLSEAATVSEVGVRFRVNSNSSVGYDVVLVKENGEKEEFTGFQSAGVMDTGMLQKPFYSNENYTHAILTLTDDNHKMKVKIIEKKVRK